MDENLRELNDSIRELIETMAMLGTTLSALHDEELQEQKEYNKNLKKTNRTLEDTSKLVDQYGKELGDITGATKKLADATDEATKSTEKNKISDLVYHRNQRNAFRDLVHELGHSRAAFSRIEEKALSLAKGNRLLQTGVMTLSAGFKGLTSSMVSFGRALYDGQQGMSITATAMSQLIKPVTALATGLGLAALLVAPLTAVAATAKVVGGVLLGVATALGAFVGWLGLSATMLDALYDSYKSISKAGLSASDGFEAIADGAQALGYGLSKTGIENFSRLLEGSSESLALMSGSAITGRKRLIEFGDIVRDDVGRELMNLGLAPEQIAEGVTAFVDNQVKLGRAQIMTNAQLRQGSVEYIKRLDQLSKLTGQNAKDIRAQMDANRRNERFRAYIERVRLEKGDVAAQTLEMNMAALAKTSTSTANSLMDISSGFADTDAGKQGVMSGLTRGMVEAMTERLGGGFDEINAAVGRTATTFGISMGQIGQYTRIFGDLNEAFKLRGMSELDFKKATDAVIEEQKNQLVGQNKLTKTQVDTVRSQMEVRDSLQNLILQGLEPAQGVLQFFTDAVLAATNALEDMLSWFGVETPRKMEEKARVSRGQTIDQEQIRERDIQTSIASGAEIPAQMESGAAATPLRPSMLGRALSSIGLGPSAQQRPEDPLAGLNIRNRPEATGGGQATPELISTAKAIQELFPDATFSALNDVYHQENSPNSKHTVGRALDFFLSPANTPTREQAAEIKKQLQQLPGVTKVRDEYYADKDINTTRGSHFHVEMLNGGIATGPKQGYQAMLHGTEAVVPLPGGRNIPVEFDNRFSDSIKKQLSVMQTQITKMDEMISVMKDNNAINSKILQVARN